MQELIFRINIVSSYIFQERTKNAQFIIISLRANMFELADTLVGIFKVHNCTDSITVTPDVYSDVSALVVTNLISYLKISYLFYFSTL